MHLWKILVAEWDFGLKYILLGFFGYFNISVSDLRTYLRQTSSEKETWWWGGGYGLVWPINHIINKVPRKHQLWGLFIPLLWTVGYLK